MLNKQRKNTLVELFWWRLLDTFEKTKKITTAFFDIFTGSLSMQAAVQCILGVIERRNGEFPALLLNKVHVQATLRKSGASDGTRHL